MKIILPVQFYCHLPVRKIYRGNEHFGRYFEKYGLSPEKSKGLSYHSNLGIRLKKNLHYFDKDLLFKEWDEVNAWQDCCDDLHDIVTDYRIKSIQSTRLKYGRYYPDHQMGKAYDDGYRGIHVYYMYINVTTPLLHHF